MEEKPLNFLRTKMSLVILLCMVLSIFAIGSTSIFTANNILRDSSRQNLQLQCENTGRKMNESLDSIAHAVDILSQNTLTSLDDLEEFKRNRAYADAYTQKSANLAKTLAENTPGCVSVYIRYNPEISSPTAGFHWQRNETDGRFYSTPCTDLSRYRPDDMDHVGWYYLPRQHKAPTWMLPYQNNQTDMYIVSYIVPIFINTEYVGIAGMDINFKYIQKITQDIHLYSSGYAFLMYKDKIIEHPDFPVYTPIEKILGSSSSGLSDAIESPSRSLGEYNYDGINKSFASTRLHNGMQLFVCAPAGEIYHASSLLTRHIVLIAIISFILITFIANCIMTRILKLATKDELTGLPNRTYFLRAFNASQILPGSPAISLFLMDVDEFKKINDTYGHNNGDLVLQNIAADASRILGKDTLFARWGGDEFIGLMKSDEAEARLEELRSHVESVIHENYGKITLSIGVAPIKKGMTFIEITQAADMALYRSKAAGSNRVTFYEEALASI
jgi:diguanylate cyclase (GGDEF)-like protein